MNQLLLRPLASVLAFGIGLIAHSATTDKLPETVFTPPKEEVILSALPTPIIYTQFPVPVMAKTTVVVDYDDEAFNPYGDYVFYGRAPRHFKEIFSLQLHNSAISMTTGNNYDYSEETVTTAFINEERLIFTAKSTTDRKFEYKFDGQFLRGGTLREAPAGIALLTGKLAKYNGDRKVAEAVVKFKLSFQDCWH